MGEEEIDDPPLDAKQQAKVDALSSSEIESIDQALFENTALHWRKVAYVVGRTMQGLEKRIPGIPDVFYAQRIKALVSKGHLVSQGNLDRMRYSEVKRKSMNA